MKAIGIRDVVTDISLTLPETVLTMARQKFPINSLAPRIGFHPGSGIDLGKNVKRWPIMQFAQLADMLARKYGAEICVFGGPEESQLIHSMISNMTEHANSFTNQNIQETAALISCCDVFVSNDSGLMHIAAAMKVPVIGIFGPTLWWKNSPWGTPHMIVRCDMSCAPCYKLSGVSCRDQKCLSEITVKDVFDAVNTLLSNRL